MYIPPKYSNAIFQPPWLIQKKTKAIENETSSKLKRPYITTISDDDYRINGKVDRNVKKGHTHYHESEGETELMNRYEDTLNSKCAMST